MHVVTGLGSRWCPRCVHRGWPKSSLCWAHSRQEGLLTTKRIVQPKRIISAQVLVFNTLPMLISSSGWFYYSLMVKMISGLLGWRFRFSQSLSTYVTGCRGNYITGLTNGNNPLLSERITVSQRWGKLKTRSFFCSIYLIFYSVICLQQY